MALDLKKLNAETFCDLQGVSDVDRDVIKRMHGKKEMSYEQWWTLTNTQFVSVKSKKSLETKK